MVEAGMDPVPVIDLQDFPDQSGRLIRACEEWGCFRVVNFDHMLSESLMLEMKEVVRSMMELPMDIKKRNVDVIPGSGYMAPSRMNPHHEAFGLYDMASVEDVVSFCSNLGSTPHQRSTIMNYAKAINELQVDIARKVGEGLGVKSFSFANWACQFRINKYNFTPETNVGSPGIQLHTDSSFLTVLQDDEIVSGLEIMKKCGTFVAVDPFPGSLLVNIGDIGTVWSNGRLLNVRHRVICKEATIRVSIASFFLGPKEAMVDVPDELVDEEHPRLYAPFSYQDYRSARVAHNLQTGGTIDLFMVESKN